MIYKLTSSQSNCNSTPLSVVDNYFALEAIQFLPFKLGLPKPVSERIEILECFNSRIIPERIKLVWK